MFLGSENMEIDEVVSPTEPMVIDLKIKECKPKNNISVELLISRALNATWNVNCEGLLIVPITANDYLDQNAASLNDYDHIDLRILIDRIIIEVIYRHFDGSLITKFENMVYVGKKVFKTTPIQQNDLSTPMNVIEDECPKPTITRTLSTKENALRYLINSYSNCYMEAGKLTSVDQKLIDLIDIMKRSIIKQSILVLTGVIAPPVHDDLLPLVNLFYEKSVCEDFLMDLIRETHNNDYTTFEKIFVPVLKKLFINMQSSISSKILSTESLMILSDLSRVTLNTNNAVRPLCVLITQLRNFKPTLTTSAAGREIAKISFLAPFLSLSVFVEDNSKIAEHYFQSQTIFDKNIVYSLQSVCSI